MPIPPFDHNLVLPPHLGTPTKSSHLSPYPCTTLELCQRFATTSERREILGRFLDFRERLQALGLLNGYQWLDGSFLEDVETRENRAPNDLDVVTVYWGYDRAYQAGLGQAFPEFSHRSLSKQNFRLDHFPFDAGLAPQQTVEYTRFFLQLFTHNRQGVWKGMLQVALNTPGDDTAARQELTKAHP